MTRLPLGAAALVAASAVAAAADPTPADLARDLGSPSFRTREAASQALWKMGAPAAPALEAAARGPSPEAAARAQAVLDKFGWGIYPDTPPDTLAAIQAFRLGSYDQQYDVIADLIRRGPAHLATARALLAKGFARVPNNPTFDSRANAFNRLHLALRRQVPALIRGGKLDEAGDLLSLQLAGPNHAGHLDYATYAAGRGKGTEALAALKAEKAAGKPGLDLAIAFLERSNGTPAAARAVVDGLAKADPAMARLREGLLIDLAAWGDLADAPPADPSNSALGIQAFRLRRAGRTKEADDLLEQAKGLPPAGRGGFAIDEHAMALLLNGRTADGLDRLKTVKSAPHVLADLLAARLEFAEALDLINLGLKEKPADKTDDDDDDVRPSQVKTLYALKRGRLLAQLGKRDAAAQVFAAVNDEADATNTFHVTQAVKAEVRSGFHDLAAELVGRMQAAADADENRNRFRGGYASQDPYENLFGDDADAAHFWWAAMRRAKPGEKGGVRMRAVRDLLAGRMPKAELDGWLKTADAQDAPDPRSVEGFRRATGLATGYRVAGKPKEAVARLAAVADAWAANPEPDPNDAYDLGTRSWVFGVDEKFRLWVELGDLLTALGDHKEAARRYEQGWQRYPDNPVPLWLAGGARAKAGDAADGAKMKAAAHLVALGNARTRGRFLEELIARAAPTAELRQACDDTRRCAWGTEGSVGNVWNQVGRASGMIKDHAAAAEANARGAYYVLRTPGVAYVEGIAYASVPLAERSYSARRLLAEGKVDEAMAAARETLAILPTHSEMVIAMVPDLDKLKRTKEADELFALVWQPLAKVAADNPESGWARYAAAWAAAGCRRELDKALAFATKAVETEPANRNFRECLAEVQFRLGKREPAAKAMAALAAEEPRNWHYHRQLDRYKTAAFDSPLPDAGDD